MHGVCESTYLSCGAEWLPGTWTGKQWWAAPTTASCRSSHTDLHTHNSLPVSMCLPQGINITTVDENAPTAEFRHFMRTSFICTSIHCHLPPSILSPSFSFFFCVCECVCSPLRPGRLGSHLEIIRIWRTPALLAGLFSQLLADCLTGWLVQLLCDSPTDWINRWRTNWAIDWLSILASYEPEPKHYKRWMGSLEKSSGLIKRHHYLNRWFRFLSIGNIETLLWWCQTKQETSSQVMWQIYLFDWR